MKPSLHLQRTIEIAKQLAPPLELPGQGSFCGDREETAQRLRTRHRHALERRLQGWPRFRFRCWLRRRPVLAPISWSQLDVSFSGITLCVRVFWIYEKADCTGRGHQTVQQFHLLAGQAIHQEGNARDVVAGPVEACDNTEFDRVATHRKNYRDRSRYDWLDFDHRDRTPSRDQHVHVTGDQFRRQRWQLIKVALCEAKLNGEAPAFSEANLVQALSKCSNEVPGITGGSTAAITDHGFRWLLRPPATRPSHRSPWQRDELAALHVRPSTIKV